MRKAIAKCRPMTRVVPAVADCIMTGTSTGQIVQLHDDSIVIQWAGGGTDRILTNLLRHAGQSGGHELWRIMYADRRKHLHHVRATH